MESNYYKHVMPVRAPIARKWPWDAYDTNTWKYIDFEVIGKGKNQKIKWILNPDFAYKHLDTE